jgi:hypothetical protein
MTIRQCVDITPSAARKGREHHAGDVHHLEVDVTAAAQDGEPPLFWAGQMLGRTATAAIVATLREEAGIRPPDEAVRWTNFVKSLLKFVVNCVNSF